MEPWPFRDFHILGQIGVFPPERPRETPGTQHLPCLLPLSLQQDIPTPFPGGPTASPASLTGPVTACLWFVQFLQLEAEQEGNSQVPVWFLVVRGARNDELHCGMSDKTRLLPAV